jgi:hypothetical protein
MEITRAVVAVLVTVMSIIFWPFQFSRPSEIIIEFFFGWGEA